MTLDLSRVQKLHEAAIAAGLPGVLQDECEIVWSAGEYGLYRPARHHSRPCQMYGLVAQAAVAWWLRHWCFVNDPHEDWGVRKVTGDPAGKYYLFWAEEIVANHKENS